MKKNKSFLIFALLLCCLLSLKLKAQTSWIADQTTGGISFYHRFSICNGDSVVLLKFINTTERALVVRWNELFNTQLETGISGWRGIKQLVLQPGVTSSENCDELLFPACVIKRTDISPAYKASFISFSFTNIIIAEQ